MEQSLEAYLARAKVVLQQKNIINPKPLKRLMRKIQDEDEEEEQVGAAAVEEELVTARTLSSETQSFNDNSKELRPVRSAKAKAAGNLVNNSNDIEKCFTINFSLIHRKKLQAL